ncbi:MAG: ParB N-terminal domain-containing protein [Rhizobiaceae bacterium]|nr:ParB N-terminal domain-containing protein [Rhizobiaceae bacterium]
MTANPSTNGVAADIEIALVDVLPGRRKLDPARVEALSDLFGSQGQTTSIEVIEKDGRYRLVFGGHRLAAAKLIGWRTIRATIKQPSDFASEAEITLREITENLAHRALSVLDRAVDIARWREIYEATHLLNKGGRKRKDVDPEELSTKFGLSFSEAAQKAFGLSRGSIFNAVKIASIDAETRDLIALLPIADNQSELLLLAAQSAARQAEVAELLNAVPDAPASVTEAIAILDRLPKPQAEPRWQKLAASFSAMKPAEQFRFFDLHEAAIRLWLKERGA